MMAVIVKAIRKVTRLPSSLFYSSLVCCINYFLNVNEYKLTSRVCTVMSVGITNHEENPSHSDFGKLTEKLKRSNKTDKKESNKAAVEPAVRDNEKLAHCGTARSTVRNIVTVLIIVMVMTVTKLQNVMLCLLTCL